MDNSVQCELCNKYFKSRAALGSHKKAHKPKRQPPPTDEAAAGLMKLMVAEDYLQPLQALPPLMKNNNNVVAEDHQAQGGGGGGRFVCVDCNISFPSHHALGGHRSGKHSRRNRRLLPSSSEPNQGLRRSMRLFGVNLDVQASS